MEVTEPPCSALDPKLVSEEPTPYIWAASGFQRYGTVPESALTDKLSRRSLKSGHQRRRMVQAHFGEQAAV